MSERLHSDIRREASHPVLEHFNVGLGSYRKAELVDFIDCIDYVVEAADKAYSKTPGVEHAIDQLSAMRTRLVEVEDLHPFLKVEAQSLIEWELGTNLLNLDIKPPVNSSEIAIPCDGCPNLRTNLASENQAVLLSPSGEQEYLSTTTEKFEPAIGPLRSDVKRAIVGCRSTNGSGTGRQTGDCPAISRFFDSRSPRQATHAYERSAEILNRRTNGS